MTEAKRILCVDDEPNVLNAMQRTLFEDYDVTTANSGAEALEVIAEDEPFSVIISDMRMPEMDGATLLARARQLSPDTVRMLLTGQTDIAAAISAINDGQIFRFLCKPCPPDQLKGALAAAHQQYSLVRAERQLLEDTLNGAVKVLTETLSLAAPLAFQRSSSLKALVSHMTKQLELENAWQFPIAAMLAPIGCITLPSDVVARVYSGKALNKTEEQMVARHPEVGRMLLGKIPRLEAVAEMVALQTTLMPKGVSEEVATGAAMLRLAMEVDAELGQGKPLLEILRVAQASRSYPIRMVASLRNFSHVQEGTKKTIKVSELKPGMIVLEDLLAANDVVLVAKGRTVDEVSIHRLENIARGTGVREPFDVLCPH
jgi:response regulator RpfG family c-di-GMP phosphodiesterase